VQLEQGEELHDAFIAYMETNKKDAERLAEMLVDQAKVRPYLDIWHLIPGTVAQEQLENALAKSASFVVLIGAQGIGPWERMELRTAIELAAREGKLRVIPVLLPGAAEANIEALPAFLRQFAWVDCRQGFDNREAFDRLVGGILGKPVGRRTSPNLTPGSLFTKRGTRELFLAALPEDLRDINVDISMPLDKIARLAHIRHQRYSVSQLREIFSHARGVVYDEKYAARKTSDDERYLDSSAWESELRRIIKDLGVRDLSQIDAINVGIGNGNESPDIYREFRKFTGVDVSSKSLDRAQKVLPFMHAVHAEAEHLKTIPTASQDLYISLRTYQSSFFDIEAAAVEADRIVRPNGFAIISIAHVYIENNAIRQGLQRAGSLTLDPNLPWEIVDRVRRAFQQAEFYCRVQSGTVELYVVGQKQ